MDKNTLNVLIVSNGYGEDQIACNLIKASKKTKSAQRMDFFALPLVGQGLEYQKYGIEPLIKNPLLPSGGFIRGLSSLYKDLKAGLLGQVFQQRKKISKIATKIDLTICVGDVYCLLLGSYKNKSPKYFIPTAKSDLFAKHSKLEIWLMNKYAKLVFPRDPQTTDSLAQVGLQTYFFGNPMMAGIECSTNKNEKGVKTIGLMPGSREEAYDNFNYILKVIEGVKAQNKVCFKLAKANSFSLEKLGVKLAGTDWLVKPEQQKIMNNELGFSIEVSEDFNNVLSSSDFFVGLAGTANEQAIYCQKKVICFEGFGPQSTKTRFEEQQKLLGDNIVFIKKREESSIREQIIKLLSSGNESLDKTRPPKTDSAAKIMEQVFTHFNSQNKNT
ncbi:lipid-A-disaccharide synthase-related protein [Candidatus Margulisiibacteriota bacterium]